jgi:hypothetical protein
MDINRKAPVLATNMIEVAADLETIWSIMAAIDHWPDWNPAVKSASIDGEFIPGSRFRWKASHATRLQRVERPNALAWTGKTLGIKCDPHLGLEPKDCKTIITTKESWEGSLAWIFRDSMQKMLQKPIDEGLQYLKEEAEIESNTP